MKVLLLSDSHGAQGLMELALRALKPDIAIHLGDCCADAQILQDAHPSLRLLSVAGNCDAYDIRGFAPNELQPEIGGLRFFLCHGHTYHVKEGPYALAMAGKKRNAAVTLFGHTHEAYVSEYDGMLMMNPGSCRSFAGSVGLIVIENNSIIQAKILTKYQLEDML